MSPLRSVEPGDCVRHYYCFYNSSKIIKVDWSVMDSDVSRYEIEAAFIVSVIDIQAAFESHLSVVKMRGQRLPCFSNVNICSVKFEKRENTAFLYFYDALEFERNVVLVLKTVKQGPAGTCCL